MKIVKKRSGLIHFLFLNYLIFARRSSKASYRGQHSIPWREEEPDPHAEARSFQVRTGVWNLPGQTTCCCRHRFQRSEG